MSEVSSRFSFSHYNMETYLTGATSPLTPLDSPTHTPPPNESQINSPNPPPTHNSPSPDPPIEPENIIRPPLPPMGGLKTPPPATIPPTDRDIVLAHEYVIKAGAAREDAIHRGEDFDLARQDYAQAIRYEARVLAHTEDGKQDWIRSVLDKILATLRELKDQVTTLSGRQSDMMRGFAKQHNFQRGHGPFVPLQIVPFPDGSYPSEHNLPPLSTPMIVENLSPVHRNEYLIRYYGEVPQDPAADGTEMLFKALGCQFDT